MATKVEAEMNRPLGPDAERLAAVPFRVVDPERIPAQRYYDQGFFELERKKLWPKVWQMAARLEEIPEIGDYVEYKILDKSVIVVRAKSGVKAFHNACRHRGVQLVADHGNCKNKGFICPFHGWRWNLDGENTFVFGRQIFSEELLDKAELNLVACRIETWGGNAFINFDNNAPSLLDSLGPITKRFDVRNLDKLRMEYWYATVLPTNWKLAMEAFQEGYHTMRTHPQLVMPSMPGAFGNDVETPPMPKQLDSSGMIEMMIKFMRRISTGMGGMIHASEVKIAESLRDIDLPSDPVAALELFMTKLKDEIHQQGVAKGLPVPDLNAVDKSHPHRTVEYFFPHYFLLPTYSAMSSYRVRPLTAETCLFELFSLAFLNEAEQREPVRPVYLPYNSKEFPEIPQQDYSNLPKQQQGLHASGFEFMRLGGRAEGLISNYQRLIDGFLSELGPDLLTRAQHLVNDGFDHPIIDIGF